MLIAQFRFKALFTLPTYPGREYWVFFVVIQVTSKNVRQV